MRYFIIFLLFLFTNRSVTGQSHAALTTVLKKHVSASGVVNYKTLIKDSASLSRYLYALGNNPPDKKKWSREEQMAYWINAYNAFTLQLIIKYYPIKSIKDIGSSIQIPFVNTPWDIKFITIGKEKFDLNNIEHGMLRKAFDDPRIHMALVCASKSCPALLNEAYEAATLNEQLDKQAKAFLTDRTRNQVTATAPRLSMIFRWYAMDFNKGGQSVRSFINKYSPEKISAEARLNYLDYDWSLNE